MANSKSAMKSSSAEKKSAKRKTKSPSVNQGNAANRSVIGPGGMRNSTMGGKSSPTRKRLAPVEKYGSGL